MVWQRSDMSKRFRSQEYKAQQREYMRARRERLKADPNYKRKPWVPGEKSKAKKSSYARKRYLQHKRFLVELKEGMGGKCVECGAVDSVEFDHKDPGTKVFAMSQSHGYEREAVIEEAGKCQLLCRACHWAKTRAEHAVSAFKMKDEVKARRLRENAKYIENKKTSCVVCGAKEMLEFDHVRGVKFRAVAMMKAYSRKRIDDEIAKCEIVCRKCHNARTARRVASGECRVGRPRKSAGVAER